MILLEINTRHSNNFYPVRELAFFNSFEVEMKFDSVASTFQFVFYFDPNNKEHAELACVSHYHECKIYYQHENTKELLITGLITSQSFRDTNAPELAAIGGYSKTGVLGDCDIPTDIYPLESEGLSFKTICAKIIRPFGLSLKVESQAASGASSQFKVEDSADEDIDKSTAPESRNALSYLVELATQKNIVISHTETGKVLISAAKIGSKPIFEIDVDAGKSNVAFTEMTMDFNGTQIHSTITVVQQADEDDDNGAEFTIRNPFIPPRAVKRPRVVVMTSGNQNTIQQYARLVLGEELKNIRLRILMDRGALNGKFIKPNQTILVRNRNCFIYKKTKFFIESVKYTETAESESMELICVPTCVYGGEVKNFFVDPHENLPRI